MLELKNITKDYPVGDSAVHALRGVSVRFRENEFVSVLGPSGCGKTTLLNIIGGLDRFSAGDLMINGVSTKEFRDRDWDSYRNHRVGFVFQTYNLIPHQSVLANVELALTLSGVSQKERRARARDVLEQVGLGDQLSKKPNQLSGGQAQRVAIARALVNNPSILLADEPTGALDSETSLQIMELLKQVAQDRLVIMVTHNPELANAYSTRVLRLLDGKIVGDTMPCEGGAEDKRAAKKKDGKTSMSFFTALSLSLQNLMTKKTRTLLIAFAGSIGIIGIALILSMSNGSQQLINRMERETLSSYPLTLERASVDFSSMMTMGSEEPQDGLQRDDAHIYSENVMSNMIDSMVRGSKVNNLSAFKAYLDSGESGIEALTSDIAYTYSTPLNLYRLDDGGSVTQVNPNPLFADLGVMPEGSDGTMSMGMFQMSTDVWVQLTSNTDLLDTQYDLLSGRLPQSYNEVVLLVDEDNRVTDFTLYSLGLLDTAALQAQLAAAAKGEEVTIDTSAHVYDFDELLGLQFKLLTNTDLFVQENGLWTDKSGDAPYLLSILTQSEDISVVGILKPAADATAKVQTGVIGYRADLMSHLLEKVNTSQIVLAQKADPTTDVFTGLPFPDGAPKAYTMDELNAFIAAQEPAAQQELTGYVEQLRAAGTPEDAIATQLMNSALSGTAQASYENNLKRMGSADPDDPDAILLYPVDFEAKDKIAKLIDGYNKGLPEDEKLVYTDYVGLMISSVTTIIDAVSYILIAFVAVSLVVSSIMIGIITYISVLERTREIGVLRSIGASKRDISRVFNAETLTIGFVAGAIGIGITLLLILPINAIIEHLSELASVASLPTGGAVILVAISMLLTFIAGLIPSRIASKKDPVIALRTE